MFYIFYLSVSSVDSAISKRLERADMAKAIEAMREDPDYARESDSLDKGLMEDLPHEPENWWQG
jgi:hypothetical protein